MQLRELIARIDSWLEPGRFRDYCPNGLQVEGRSEVKRIVCGVTACEALIDAAIAADADAILVHHGYFWRNEAPSIVGLKARRIGKLLRHDISLIAYHLPLDTHPELGNNRGLAQQLGLEVLAQESAGEVPGLLWVGQLPQTMDREALARHVASALGREPLLLGGKDPETYRRIAWCTGGAQGYLERAADLGVDVYLSGEASEQTFHLAQERGLLYVASGHHATERYGVQRLAARLQQECGLDCRYVDIDNPV